MDWKVAINEILDGWEGSGPDCGGMLFGQGTTTETGATAALLATERVWTLLNDLSVCHSLRFLDG